MKGHWLLTFALLGMLGGCGKESGSIAAGEEAAAGNRASSAGEAKNIVDATGAKVDAAVAAGTKALDDAIEQAEGGQQEP